MNQKIDLSQKLVPNANEVALGLDPTMGTAQVGYLTGHLCGINAPWVDEHPDMLQLIGGSSSSPLGMTPNIASDLQNLLGFQTKQLFFDRVFDSGPTLLTIGDIAPFYTWLQTQQGNPQTGFYFIGEYLAGHGVPENFQYTLQFVQKYFAALLSQGGQGELGHRGQSGGQSGPGSRFMRQAKYGSLQPK